MNRFHAPAEVDAALSGPQPIFLRDYRPPAFLIDAVDLTISLGEAETLVSSVMQIRRNPAGPPDAELVLDGVNLDLRGLKIDGQTVEEGADFAVGPDALRILRPLPNVVTVAVETAIRPQDNSDLEGLYKSSGMFCTQCEAEGFRKITYYLDRPDVMARFSTRIIADKQAYPVLLSNGNRVESGDLDDGLHFALWQDPFPKPAYLFALVAGDLAVIEDRFVTQSGRSVDLRLYAAAADIDKCRHAMESLKQSMAWDEQVYGFEYDLDIYMIVAVGDFNMGAMENKGLNVFNTRFVLAKPETATDNDFRDIERVIAHEYFHNWTGNRVTCRDWFQLSLKEGLTVFRDQRFSADMGSPAVKRLSDLRQLRNAQFPEDSGPTAHPVRPDSYIEINNFYTATVYLKGAEVVRMIHTLLGPERFRAGMDLYIARHDGQAVTCDDFVAAMEDASGVDLAQFHRWYGQAGTPVLTVSTVWSAADGVYELRVAQSCPPTPSQPDKLPLHIPLTLALLNPTGTPVPLRLEGEEEASSPVRVLDVTEPDQRFCFVGLTERPVPSLLRDFSAPVKLVSDLTDAELIFLMARDDDAFSRWEAGQTLAVRRVTELVERGHSGRALTVDHAFIAAIGATLSDHRLDREFIAEAITLPGETFMIEMAKTADPEAIHHAREFLRRAIGNGLHEDLRRLYAELAPTHRYSIDAESIARRSLRNVSLAYLMASEDPDASRLAAAQYRDADNMTDVLAALALIADDDGPDRHDILADFERRWQHEPLVLDKWFTVQAHSSRADTLERVVELLHHPRFDLRNPNKVRALIGGFASGNPFRFHQADGSGYRFLADRVLELDPINGKVASRLMGPLIRWRKFDEPRQLLMCAELERIVASPTLSKDVFEIASKALSES